MKVSLYNQKGKEIGTTLLPQEVFAVPFNSDLVYQVTRSLLMNQRQGTAKVKDRSEVRGGGKKPWRQKGTGRARHGSRRSPIWIGGGVTFGPVKEKDFKKKINKKVRRKALKMILSAKVRENLLIVLDKIELEKAKTKEFTEIIKKFPLPAKSFLIALPGMDEKVLRASQNIKKVKVVQARELNVLDLISSQCLVLPEEAIKIIKETFL